MDIFWNSPIQPGDFATKVKQINSQSDLTYMLSFAAHLTSQSDTLSSSFNLRSLYFQSLQSLTNLMQLHALRNLTNVHFISMNK